MTPESFFHVSVKTEDMDEGVTFYQDHFDVDLRDRDTMVVNDVEIEFAVMHIADKRLFLFDQAPYEAANLVDSLPPGVLHFGFVVDDLVATYEELRNEVPCIMPPTDFDGIRAAFISAPDNVRIELLEIP